MQLQYDDSNIDSIIEYSALLKNKTFLEIINDSSFSNDIKEELITYYSNPNFKGGLGMLLEKLYFGYANNSNQEADFSKVGVELKSSPYEVKKDGTLRAGERLSVTMVPHDRPIEQDFYKSDVWHKIHLILLVYYLRNRQSSSRLDFRIDYSYLFTPPEKDLKIIIDDFNKIVEKVISGRAHEISESDTLYLGACTKGATAEKSIHPQYYGNHTPAKSRNFCLKQGYMSYVLNEYISKGINLYESVVKNAEELNNKTFEDYVVGMIDKNIGKSDYQLCNELGREYNNNKAQWIDLSYRMLGIKSNKAEEFEKANIVVKAIRIEENGNIKENMSFPVFKYLDIINEEWEDSELNNYFDETKFLFVVFKKKGDKYYLKGSQFWNMPYEVLNGEVKNGWLKTVNTIRTGVQWNVEVDSNGKNIVRNNLLKKSENRIIHIRPHAQKSYYEYTDGKIIGNGKKSDANVLPDGRYMTNHCFWINNDYILGILKSNLKDEN